MEKSIYAGMEFTLKSTLRIACAILAAFSAPSVFAEMKDTSQFTPSPHQATFMKRPECALNAAMHMGDISEHPLLICPISINYKSRNVSVTVWLDGRVEEEVSYSKILTNTKQIDGKIFSKMFKDFLNLGPIKESRQIVYECTHGIPEEKLREISFQFLKIENEPEFPGYSGTQPVTFTFNLPAIKALAPEKLKAVQEIKNLFLSSVGVDEGELKEAARKKREFFDHSVVIDGKSFSVKNGKLVPRSR